MVRNRVSVVTVVARREVEVCGRLWLMMIAERLLFFESLKMPVRVPRLQISISD